MLSCGLGSSPNGGRVLATVPLSSRSRRVMLPGTALEHALDRCLDMASPFGPVRLNPQTHPGVREFLLGLGEDGSRRLRWTLTSSGRGTELCITRDNRVAWLPPLGHKSWTADHELTRRLNLLPHVMNLNIVVLGGGTGLYATLLGLRDQTSSLVAIISAVPPPLRRRKALDELGSLPVDDASISLVALAPSLEENLILRRLLEHRMRDGGYEGAIFGTIWLEALTELFGSRQAALNEGGRLLGIGGRIILATDEGGERSDQPSAGAQEAIQSADLVVLAPGHFESDLRPILTTSGLADALRASRAPKVAVTKMMTAEHEQGEARTSSEVAMLIRAVPDVFDTILANEPALTEKQLASYDAEGARPIVPDVEATSRSAKRLVTERLAAKGNLARHDPALLGECLIKIGAAALVESTKPLNSREPVLTPQQAGEPVVQVGV